LGAKAPFSKPKDKIKTASQTQLSTHMRKILLIFKREYITRVRKKSFIITTLLVPLGFIILIAIQAALLSYSSSGKMRIAVKDDTQNEVFAHRFKDTPNLYFKKVSTSLEALEQNYHELDFDGILYIPDINLDKPNGIRYISDQSLGMSVKSYVQREIKSEIKRLKLKDFGVDNKAFKRIEKLHINITEQGTEGSDMASTGIATGVGYFMGMLMYFVIFIYGSMVMRSVMEEKSNRIVEVILSSVKPFKLMIGKILGVGAVGLTQFAIWIVLLFFINIFMSIIIGSTVDLSGAQMGANEQEMEQAMELWESVQGHFSELPIRLLIGSLLFYFLGGYVLYAALFAGLAAAVNDESDVQTLTIPISIPVVLAVFILIAIIENPNSGLAVWSSMFPLFSPIIMPARIAFGVPTYQLILSMSLLILGCIIAIWVAAKIYRIGILMYGKKISFREIGKWLFTSH